MATKSILKPSTPKKQTNSKFTIKSTRPYGRPYCSHKIKDKSKTYSCSGSINSTTESFDCKVVCCIRCASKHLGEYNGLYFCAKHYPSPLPCGHLTDSFVKCDQCDAYREKLISSSSCLACHELIAIVESRLGLFGGYHARCVPELCHKCMRSSCHTFQNRGWCKECLVKFFNPINAPSSLHL